VSSGDSSPTKHSVWNESSRHNLNKIAEQIKQDYNKGLIDTKPSKLRLSRRFIEFSEELRDDKQKVYILHSAQHITMMIIKDSMVLIHLAKISLLEKSCDYFKRIIIPKLVYKEIIKGEEKGFPDVQIIAGLIKNKKITIKKVEDKKRIKRANQFNIQGGEAEVVALYWQEKANMIATDDDNVRKKKVLLNLKIIGTPSIILGLYKKKMINREKLTQSISELKKIGWFSNAILDNMLMEAKNE